MGNPNSEPQITAILQAWITSSRLHDFYFIEVKQLNITPKVRLKCMYGCPNYNVARKCPPKDTLTPEQCQSYIREYSQAVILRFAPDAKQLCPKHVQTDMLELERHVFLQDRPFALAIFPKHCDLCESCDPKKPCTQPTRARPSISSMCIDIIGTMKKLGQQQQILTNKSEATPWSIS